MIRRALLSGLLLAASLTGMPAWANSSDPACLYDVAVGPRAETLEVRIACPGEEAVALVPARGYFTRYARRIDGAEGWQAQSGGGVARAAYAFELGRLAADFHSLEHAARIGDSVLALPASFLVRPADPDRGMSLAFAGQDGAGIATGLPRGDGGRHRLAGRELFFAGYMAFGAIAEQRLELPPPPFAPPGAPPARLSIVTLDGRFAGGGDMLHRWIADSARLVADYWGGFPAEQALLVLDPVRGRGGVAFGRVIGGGGITAILQVGEQAAPEQLRRDWILIHELLHVGSPFVHDRGYWFMEGMATYVEPIIRARAGWLTSQEVWAEFARGMPRGVGPMNELGLAQVRGRDVYWSGALFMLMADIEIRRRSAGRSSLDDCLRGLLKAGGNATQRWTTERVIQTCDSATGTGVAGELAARHVHAANPVDLDALWRDLGVLSDGRMASYRQDAPLAWIRRAILPD
ncbi:MAG: hypothetical protein KIT20_02495 [Alphaproteobacteria bacterium]|nr:hypothetical protein [Alphaproteobacteria bacterium]